jgi:hypothetical protein
MDLLESHSRIGFFAVTYWITIGMLYRLKRQFFEDKLSTLPVMTFFFGLFSTVIQAILLNAMGIALHLTGQWIVTDLLLYPLVDALYALLWFAIPSYLLRRRPQSRDNTMSFR